VEVLVKDEHDHWTTANRFERMASGVALLLTCEQTKDHLDHPPNSHLSYGPFRRSVASSWGKPIRIVTERDQIEISGFSSSQAKGSYDPYFGRVNFTPAINGSGANAVSESEQRFRLHHPNSGMQ